MSRYTLRETRSVVGPRKEDRLARKIEVRDTVGGDLIAVFFLPHHRDDAEVWALSGVVAAMLNDGSKPA